MTAAKLRRFRVVALIAAMAVVTSFTPTPSCADSWALPTPRTYASMDGRARVIVTPRDLESQLDYFEDKVDGREPAGQRRGGSPAAQARLEVRVGKQWQPVWQGPLVNEVAPVDALVADTGRYLVTFDNWHSVGYGPVVVIYGPEGERIRALALSDIVPQDYVDALPHSVSSIHWRGDPRFSTDGTRVLIPINVPSRDHMSDPAHVEFQIDLATGAPTPVDALAWTAARAEGCRVRTAQRASEAAEKAAFLAPLLGPEEQSERAWHYYLREAFYRLRGNNGFTSTTVLRMPGAKDYAVSEDWARDALVDPLGDDASLATLSEPNLVIVLQKIARRVPRGSLSHMHVYVAVSNRHWPAVVAAMSGTGARLTQLNPATPIPQRPERIAARYGPR